MSFKVKLRVSLAILAMISIVVGFGLLLYMGASNIHAFTNRVAVHELYSNKNAIKQQVEEVSEKHKELIEMRWAAIMENFLTKSTSAEQDETFKSLDSLLVELQSLKQETEDINEIVPEVDSKQITDFVTSTVVSIEKLEVLANFSIDLLHEDTLGESEKEYISEETRQVTLDMVKANQSKSILYKRMSEWKAQ